MPTGKMHAIYTYAETAQDKNGSFKYKPHLGEMNDSGFWTRDIKDTDRIILSLQKALLITCYQNYGGGCCIKRTQKTTRGSSHCPKEGHAAERNNDHNELQHNKQVC